MIYLNITDKFNIKIIFGQKAQLPLMHFVQIFQILLFDKVGINISNQFIKDLSSFKKSLLLWCSIE